MLNNWDDAPQGTIQPEILDRKGLFSLDVDGVIWKGLHMLEARLGDDRVPPRWLADENMCVAIIAYLDLQGCQVELGIIQREVTNTHVWYAEEHHSIQTAIHNAGMHVILYFRLLILTLLPILETDFALQFHLLHKLAALKEIGAIWDSSLRQLPYPAELQSIVRFASNTVPADTTSIHTPSTPVCEPEPDSDGEDCEQWAATIVISEEVRKIDEDEEGTSEGFPDDSVYASESV
jgi:hypothetical protein